MIKRTLDDFFTASRGGVLVCGAAVLAALWQAGRLHDKKAELGHYPSQRHTKRPFVGGAGTYEGHERVRLP